MQVVYCPVNESRPYLVFDSLTVDRAISTLIYGERLHGPAWGEGKEEKSPAKQDFENSNKAVHIHLPPFGTGEPSKLTEFGFLHVLFDWHVARKREV